MSSSRGRQVYRGRSHENEPLVFKRQSYSLRSRIKQHLNAEIDINYADLVLIVCYFTSGLIESGAYNAWEVFTSMQTGNTIFAALGISNLPSKSPDLAWTKSVCAILSFLLGAVFFSSLHGYFSPRKRWVLIISFTVQVVFVMASGILVYSGKASDSSPKQPNPLLHLLGESKFPLTDLIPIGLLSFQAAGNVVASRVLQHPGLPTVVLTTLYNDLVSDPGFFTGGILHNSARNRKIGAAAFYFGGAVLGGVFASTVYGFAGALWIAVTAKGLIVFAWFVWKKETEGEEHDAEQ